MASHVDTSYGEKLVNEEKMMTLRECVYNEFKDEDVAANIYQKLQEMDIADLHTLRTIDEDDMNDLCKEMGLNGIKKIKFKSLIRKQKEIKQSQQQNIITISSMEHDEIDKIEQYTQKSNGLRKSLESYINQIEEHCNHLQSQTEAKFTSIIEKIQQRHQSINNEVFVLSVVIYIICFF